MIARVPEADEPVLSACQKQVFGRVSRQTPQLVCVALNTSQHRGTEVFWSVTPCDHVTSWSVVTSRRRFTHLDLNQEAIVESSSQDEVTRRPDQKLVPLPLRHCSDGSILIWDLWGSNV